MCTKPKMGGLQETRLQEQCGMNDITAQESTSQTNRYKKPANGTLVAKFRLTEGELQEIKHEVAQQGKVDREYLIQLVDESDTVCAEVTKTIHTWCSQAQALSRRSSE